MSKIVSISLDKETEKIIKKVNRLRKYGWLSKDIRDFLKHKYGADKAILVQLLQDKQKQRDKLEEQIKELAKRINKVK